MRELDHSIISYRKDIICELSYDYSNHSFLISDQLALSYRQTGGKGDLWINPKPRRINYLIKGFPLILGKA